MTTRPAIIANSLLRLPAFLNRHSVRPLEFLSRVGLRPNIFLHAGVWLPRDFCFRVAEETAKVTGDRLFGAQVGASIRLPDLGEFGRRIASAKTLGEALRFTEAESFRVHRGSMYKIETDARNTIFHFAFLGESAFDSQQFVVGTLAVLRNIALLANEPDGVSIRLKTPCLPSRSLLEETLGARLEFGARDDAVIVDRGLLGLPIEHTTVCADNVDELPYPTVVAHLLLDQMRDGSVSLHDVAATLHCSERTVERHLNDWGITFESLQDDIRRDTAVRLVCENKHSLTEVAMELGYSDQANFTRAFRRWTGVAPSKFRQSHG